MLKQQAVLFLASHHSGPLEVELTRRNIPFVKFGGLKFLDAAHIKEMLALLRFVENPRDRVAGFRVMQLMPGVGPTSAQRPAPPHSHSPGPERSRGSRPPRSPPRGLVPQCLQYSRPARYAIRRRAAFTTRIAVRNMRWPITESSSPHMASLAP